MRREDIEDAFSEYGPVTLRSMFGGTGVYSDGVMFALEAFGELYLKADDELKSEFEALGAEPFTYEGKRKPVVMSYWRLPSALLEDRDMFAGYARKSMAAALRAGRRKKTSSDQRHV